MKIDLISKEQHTLLLEIQEDQKSLTFQNMGYQYIDKTILTEQNILSIEIIEELLKKHIYGFSNFNNFRIAENGEVQIRFQYNYNTDNSDGISFNGVGYITLNELLNGFNK